MKKGKTKKDGSKKAGSAKKEKEGQDPLVGPHIPTAEEQLWIQRFAISEHTRQHHKENATLLVAQNEALQSTIEKSEREALEIVGFLRRDIAAKEDQIKFLSDQLIEVKRIANRDKEILIDNYKGQIALLNSHLSDEKTENERLHQELQALKEFRRLKVQFDHEIEDLKSTLEEERAMHNAALKRQETKYFEEKIKLHNDNKDQLAELSRTVQQEALKNLDLTTKAALSDNVRLSEELRMHVSENASLKKEVKRLQGELSETRSHGEASSQNLVHTITKLKLQERKNIQQESKIAELELALNNLILQVETDEAQTAASIKDHDSILRGEVETLRRELVAKQSEIKRVKILARNVLDQRTTCEQFFHEALTEVRQQIATCRTQYVKDLKASYYKDLQAGGRQAAELPRIRTFSKSQNSANSIFSEFERAEELPVDISKISIKDLTWEQKERVLHILLAKINNKSADPPSSNTAPNPLPPPPPQLALGDSRRVLPLKSEASGETLPRSLPSSSLPRLPPTPPHPPKNNVFLTQADEAPYLNVTKLVGSGPRSGTPSSPFRPSPPPVSS